MVNSGAQQLPDFIGKRSIGSNTAKRPPGRVAVGAAQQDRGVLIHPGIVLSHTVAQRSASHRAAREPPGSAEGSC